MLEKEETRDKALATSVSKSFHEDVVKFCDERNWVMSRFIEKAIKESMIRVKIEEGT
jgi:hypothetical protein